MSSHALSAADPYERRQVPVLDTKMAYIDTGSGEPVVFLHGWGMSLEVWERQVHAQAQFRLRSRW